MESGRGWREESGRSWGGMGGIEVKRAKVGWSGRLEWGVGGVGGGEGGTGDGEGGVGWSRGRGGDGWSG